MARKKTRQDEKPDETDSSNHTPTPTPTPSSPKNKKKPKKKASAPADSTPIPAEKSSINDDNTPKAQKEPEPTPKKGFPRWSIEEDKKLCVAWLNTSRDTIVGKGQKATTFWERIHSTLSDLINEYNDEKKKSKNFKPLPLRPVGAVECRWGHILKCVNKFAGYYSNVERRLKSGKTRDDILTEAKELYKTTSGSPFNLDHCWGILKDTPKWQATQRENEARAKKSQRSSPPPPSTNMSSSTNDVSSPTAIDVEGDESEPSRSVLGQVRLEGSKAAKRKRAEDASIHSIVSMQKDLVTISRERLASMNAAKDDAIMSKDLSSMDDEARAYYQRSKRLHAAAHPEAYRGTSSIGDRLLKNPKHTGLPALYALVRELCGQQLWGDNTSQRDQRNWPVGPAWGMIELQLEGGMDEIALGAAGS
ncbi:uncharacterized protein PGTG_15661 [Puccinia graminis f. sp. tritici CRL 75-36-700-3]|uniref:No apical meristem-associated C-terminal domain-containing protein n=1 Tax=Puccinia graminis f. sp. tritici (strain CRL 75-36-700-3 / race SCCL) TaxID=418459 RepID=E3KYY7_PUCGT|nr:uncharacterized protein PGTG_15661 [Puccinia graminis f. sp. tritici CRL 75-36-700-3]EFP89512.1 hypothetical protein PGTG_15661 [Puccinia graminis f. sp. tritici CRL 75-36-700-3]